MNVSTISFFLFLSITFSTSLSAQKNQPMKLDTELQSKLESVIKSFKGKAGVYVFNVSKGTFASVNGDSLFPTASMIKVPIMLTIFDKISKGELSYSDELPYEGDHNYVYEADFINRLEKGTKVSIAKLLTLMISFSDNTASLWLQHLAGGGIGINEWLSKHDFNQTRVNSRTPGREAEYKQFGWGVTSPKEMATIALQINDGKLVSKNASEKMYRIMSRSFWDGEALYQMPPYVQVASKQGAVSQSKSEVAVVHSKNNTYVFCAITDKQETTGYEFEDIGYQFVRTVSRLLYKHFEPQDSWTPTDNLKEFW